MKVAVVGTGYGGLVMGTCLADGGHEVVGSDKDTAKVATLRAGQVPIFESGLEAIVESHAARG